MDGYIVHGSVGMTRGSVVLIEDGKGMLVYVWDGGVWVTQEGDSRDRFLAPGQWFLLDRKGVTVVHALKRSVLTLTAPEPVLYAKRVTLNLVGTKTPRVLYDASREKPAALARLRIKLAKFWAEAPAPWRATSAAH